MVLTGCAAARCQHGVSALLPTWCCCFVAHVRLLLRSSVDRNPASLQDSGGSHAQLLLAHRFLTPGGVQLPLMLSDRVSFRCQSTPSSPRRVLEDALVGVATIVQAAVRTGLCVCALLASALWMYMYESSLSRVVRRGVGIHRGTLERSITSSTLS